VEEASRAVDEATGAAAAPQAAARRVPPWLVPATLLLVLALLTGGVLAHGPLVSLDGHIRAAVQARATSPAWRWLGDSPHAPAVLLTDLGQYLVAVPVLAVTAVALAIRRHTARPLAAAVVGVVLLLAIVIPAKILIDRPGPGLTSATEGSWGAFPSGHTSTACVCFSLAVLLIVAGQPARTRRLALAGLTLLWLLVGAALVWCDYHWFTDVAAGWALSALIVQLALRVTGDHRVG
jgi:membrane-associated phospholipid phosphatase